MNNYTKYLEKNDKKVANLSFFFRCRDSHESKATETRVNFVNFMG